jgi:DNA-binding XRE family transcriptional regulator
MIDCSVLKKPAMVSTQPRTGAKNENCHAGEQDIPSFRFHGALFILGMTLPMVGCFEQVEKDTFCGVAIKLLTRLKELRKFHRLTQEAFSERSGISYKYYQAIEGGRKRDLRLSTLERLAKAYGIELWQLFSPHLPRTRLSKTARKHKGKQKR